MVTKRTTIHDETARGGDIPVNTSEKKLSLSVFKLGNICETEKEDQSNVVVFSPLPTTRQRLLVLSRWKDIFSEWRRGFLTRIRLGRLIQPG